MAADSYAKHAVIKENFDPARSLWFVVILLTSYVLLVRKILPRIMQRRKPFKLKEYIFCYNIAQILACVYIDLQIWSITQTGIARFWQCFMVPPTMERQSIQLHLAYFNFWLKISELSETIVFVLRQKKNQVSNLHVFHHCSMITLYYIMVNFYFEQPTLYPMFLNSNVHIIMYAYYNVAASVSKQTLRRLLPIKKSITLLQMIQFILILIHSGILLVHCQVPYIMTAYYSTVISVIFYGFYDFYKKSYRSTKHKDAMNEVK